MNNAQPLIENAIETASLETIISSLGQFVIRFGLKLIAAVAILIVGIWLANRITRSLRNVMIRRRLEQSLQSFLLSFINIVLKIFVMIIVLATVGVHMTSIIAVLGAASLAIGMALSGTMQNFAGGIVILMLKPFRVGDSIETASGDTGVVKRIMIFTTELHTFDNQVVFLPNGALANGIITNLSKGAIRRTDLTVGIAYGNSIETARRTILKILEQNNGVLNDPAPIVYISSLGDSAVVLTIRYWSKYEDILSTSTDIMEKIYSELPRKKVNFPFPQLDVHMVGARA